MARLHPAAETAANATRHDTTTMAFKLFLFLAVLAVLIPSSSAAVSARPLAARDDRSDAPAATVTPASAATVAAASAALLASSISTQLSQLAVIPAIPVPSNVTKASRVRQLATLMPPLQTIAAAAPLARRDIGPHMRHMQNATRVLADLMPPPPKAPRGAVKSLHGRQSTLRVMVVGDSMTHGQEGDWTWRYRIWQWFRAQNIAVEMVGPYVGTMQPYPVGPVTPPPLYTAAPVPGGPPRTDGGYAIGADSAFTNGSSNHFAAWGRAAAVDKGLIQQMVTDYRPDLMLLMLGFNDMGWFYSDAVGTLDSIYTLITNARAANPNLKFAVANVPQRTTLGRIDLPVKTDLYNALLRAAVPQWTTSQSPIALVELRENYDCELNGCPAGYDGLHPNAAGEFQIARAFSRGLVNGLKIGTSELAIPNDIPARSLPQLSNFSVFTSPAGVSATWTAVYGAYGYDIKSRIEGVTDWVNGSVGSPEFSTNWAFDGFTYDIQVRVSCGDELKGPWTQYQSAVAHPQTAPGPLNVVVEATATGMDISWDPPTGNYTYTISEYNILYWDRDTPCEFLAGAAFTSSPAHIDGLIPGHRYLVAPTTWNAVGGGFPEIVNDVLIGGGTPAVPSNLQIVSNDGTTVHVTWNAATGAAGYTIYIANVGAGNSTLTHYGDVEYPCFDSYFLFPGTWNYEFCVGAFNGNAKSVGTTCMTAPEPDPNNNPNLTCPLPPPWCPVNSSAPAPYPIPSVVSVLPNVDATPAPETIIVVTTTNAQGLTFTELAVNGSYTTTSQAQGATVTTFTAVGSDGSSITVVETLGQTVTMISVEGPSPTGAPSQGATITTVTTVGADGTSTVLVETLVPVTTTDSQGDIVISMSTEGAVLPSNAGPPPGATITTVMTTGTDGQATVTTQTITAVTATGSDGQTTIYVETLVLLTITNAQGQLVTSIFTEGPAPDLPAGAIATLITTTDSNGQATVEGVNLIFTTATDSVGKTVVGTMTEPVGQPTVTTSPPDIGPTTYTTFPSGVLLSSTSAASNTHDSSGHPILGHWPLCRFCPPGSNGWVLGGNFPPGVYPPPPGPIPPFATGFPALTIEPNGDPKYSSQEPSSTKTASSSCTRTQTVTNCQVFCGVAGSSSTTTCYSTSCSTVQGCSPTGTTITTISTSSGCSFTYPSDVSQLASATYCGDGCALRANAPVTGSRGLNAPPAPTDPPDQVVAAGRLKYLHKRAAASEITNFGGCTFSRGANSETVTRPAYLGPTAIYQMDQPGVLSPEYSSISRYYRATESGCIWTTTRLDSAAWAVATAQPGWSAFNSGPTDENSKLSMDHAWEVGWLKDFFTDVVLTGNGLTCSQANSFFFPANCPARNFMQEVFDELASEDNNKNFLIMSAWLNGFAKGWLVGPDYVPGQNTGIHWTVDHTRPGDWTWPSNSGLGPPYSIVDNLNVQLELAQRILLGILEVNSQEMRDAMQRTNNQIYNQLLIVDQDARGSLAQTFFGGAQTAYNNQFPNGLAPAYRFWADNTLLGRINDPQNDMSTLWQNIWTNIQETRTLVTNGQLTGYQQGELDAYNNFFLNLNEHYANANNLGWRWQNPFAWDWNGVNVKRDSLFALKRRQNGAACQSTTTLPASLSTAPLPSSGPTTTAPPTTTALPTTETVSCNPNGNLGGGDGLCTCVLGGTQTLAPTTPPGGAYQPCVTTAPTSTSLAASSVATSSSTTNAASTTATCHVHVRRSAKVNETDPNAPPYMAYNGTVYDASGQQAGEAEKDNPGFLFPLEIFGLNTYLDIWENDYGFDQPVNFDYTVQWTSAAAQNGTSSALPYCNVGDEDGVNFTQDMDCYFLCN